MALVIHGLLVIHEGSRSVHFPIKATPALRPVRECPPGQPELSWIRVDRRRLPLDCTGRVWEWYKRFAFVYPDGKTPND